MIDKLVQYIPPAAKESLELLLNNYKFHLKVVNGRKTKRGDFRATSPLTTITINNNLSKEQFLITLVHEIAHLETYNHYPTAKAHGKEWKQNFQRLMLPFLTNTIFSDDILMPLAKHLVNPKATTDSDPYLSVKLQVKNKALNSNQKFIFNLEPGALFVLKNRTFKILHKRRTRYECLEISTDKKYLVSGSAPVETI